MALDGLLHNFQVNTPPIPISWSHCITMLYMPSTYGYQSYEMHLRALQEPWLPDWRTLSGHDLFSSTCLSSPSLFSLSSTCKAPGSCLMMFSDGFCEWLTVFARRTGQLQHPEGPVIGLFVIFCLTFSQATRKWRRLTTSLVWDHDLFLYSEDRQNL